MRKISILVTALALAVAGCEKKKDAGEGDKTKSAEKQDKDGAKDTALAEDKAGDKADGKAADPAADKAADPAADKAADKAADPAADKAADPAADKAADPAADKAAVAKAPDPADGLVLPDVPDQVGEISTKTEKNSMKLQFVNKGQKIDMTIDGEESKTKEILEVVDGKATKLKITYKSTQTQTMGGKSQTKAQNLDGKTYIVWTDGTNLQMTREDGAAVTSEEEKELRKDHRRLGQRDGLDEILRGRAWKKGEPYNLTADDLAKLNKGNDEMTAKSASLTFEGDDGKVATFRMDAVMEMGDAEGKMEMEMSMTVRGEIATSHMIDMVGKGTVKGVVKGMETTGTFETNGTVTYP